MRPILYFDLASPYAYLALERAADVLGAEPELRPVLVGAIFALRGHGSWAHTDERDRRIAEVEQRARRGRAACRKLTRARGVPPSQACAAATP